MSVEMTEIVPLGEVIALLGIGGTITESQRAVLQMLKDDVEGDTREYVNHGISQPTSDYIEYHPLEDRRPGLGPPLVEFSGNTVHLQPAVHRGNLIGLRNGMVRSIAEIREDYDGRWEQESDDFPLSTVLTEGDDFALRADSKNANGVFLSMAGLVERLSGDWPARAGTVRVTYMAGLTVAELDTRRWQWIKGVLREETAKRFKYRQGLSGTDPGMGAVKQFSIGGQISVTYGTADVEAMSMGELTPTTKRRLFKIKRLDLPF